MTRRTDRAQVLVAAFEAFANGITAYTFQTCVTDASATNHHLLIDLELSEGPVSRFCDLLFHGSEDAHQLNGDLFIEGGLAFLADGIRNFRIAAQSEKHHRTKRLRQRGMRR